MVRQADAKLVEDLYEYRLLLEPAAVRMAVPHQEPAVLKQLQENSIGANNSVKSTT